jgi:hypothetical protein
MAPNPPVLVVRVLATVVTVGVVCLVGGVALAGAVVRWRLGVWPW